MNLKRWLAVVAGLLLAAAFWANERPQFTSDPDEVRLVTSDIDRFWAVMDKATPENRAELLQREYIDRGSPGVKDFVPYRILNGEDLHQMIVEQPERYSPEVWQRTFRIAEWRKKIRAGFYALKYLYPEAVFPDVYFVIGRLNSGGTSSANGLLIGAEMYGHSDEAMAGLPRIFAHEWVHFQQDYPLFDRSVLAKSMQEGSADFIAELAVGEHINPHIHEYAKPREREIWSLFEPVMHEKFGGEKTKGWMYGGSPIEGGANDLGYYVGYKICAAYYEKAEDKRKAIREILNIKDFEAFLELSGYAKTFAE